MVGIWLDNPDNPPSPNPYTAAGLITGDPNYFGGEALTATKTVFTVVSTGTLASPSIALALSAGGFVTNQTSATIAGILAGVLVTTSGSITNQAGGLISAAMDKTDIGADLEAAGVVFNAGIISGQYAIVARSGSTVTNDTGGNVTGGANGIFVGQFAYTPAVLGSGSTGTVINRGTVTAVGNGNFANGVQLNVDAAQNASAAYVLNSGAISAYTSSFNDPIGIGIAMNYGGVVNNSGRIEGGVAGVSAGGNPAKQGAGSISNAGIIFAGTYGVRLFAGGLVKNLPGATIRAYAAFTPLRTGTAVYLKQGGLVQNYGVVTGQKGVWIKGNGTVQNYGVIGLLPSSHGGGITEANQGIISNAKGATILGSSWGVSMEGTGGSPIGTITNAGFIAGYTLGGVGYFNVGPGTVTNAKTGTIQGKIFGVELNQGKTLTNEGTIAGSPTYGSFGVVLGPLTAAINANTGTISGGTVGVLVDLSATFTNQGLINGSNANGVGFKGLHSTIQQVGTLTNEAKGVISGTSYGVTFANGSMAFTNAGTITGGKKAVLLASGNANQLQVAPGAVFNGKVDGGNTIGAATASTLTLLGTSTDPVGTLAGLGPSIYNFSTITFASGASWLLQGNQAGLAGGQTFAGFAVGDTIDIGGVFTEAVRDYSGGTLTLNGMTTMQIIIPGAFTASSFSVKDGQNSDTLISILPSNQCFAAGTAILTDLGERPVENLRPGMRVVTADREVREIIWIGRRHIDCRHQARPEDVYPVRIRAGAFGPGSPVRDLRLSPDHAVLTHDVLIPVRYLINDRTIRQERAEFITYYHVELAAHDVILAENLPVESYLASGDRAQGSDASGVARNWETAAYAPLVLAGLLLAKARQYLASRALPRYARIDSRAEAVIHS